MRATTATCIWARVVRAWAAGPMLERRRGVRFRARCRALGFPRGVGQRVLQCACIGGEPQARATRRDRRGVGGHAVDGRAVAVRSRLSHVGVRVGWRQPGTGSPERTLNARGHARRTRARRCTQPTSTTRCARAPSSPRACVTCRWHAAMLILMRWLPAIKLFGLVS